MRRFSARPSRPIVLLAALSLASYAACDGDDDSTTPAPPVDEVQVSPSSATLEAFDATVQLEATALDDGEEVTGVTIEWSSDATGVATVSTSGLVTAVGEGTATITAAVGNVTGQATVTVDQVVTDASITPTQATIEVGGTEDFDGNGLDANGNVVADASITWSSMDETVATVDADGVVTGQSTGSTTVTATTDAGPSAQATVEVVEAIQPSLAKVSGDNQTDGVTARQFSQPFVVEVTDQNNDPISGEEVTWQIVEGGGSLSATSTTTGTDGRAEVTLTGDTALVTHRVEARVTDAEGSPVEFTAETTIMLVEIVDNAFRDLQGRTNANASVTVPLGTTVRWEYLETGATEHTVATGEGQNGVDGSGVPAGGTDWGSSGNLSPGQSFEFTFDTTGEWTYFCEVHPNTMFNSTVTVQ